MAPKRPGTKTAGAGARVTGARVSKTRPPQRTTARGTSETARHLLHEEQIKEKKKEVSNCKRSITMIKKKLAAEEAKLAEKLSELNELEKGFAEQVKPAKRMTRSALTSHAEQTGGEEEEASPPRGASKDQKRKRLSAEPTIGEREAKRLSDTQTRQTGCEEALGLVSTVPTPSPGVHEGSERKPPPEDSAYVAEEAAPDWAHPASVVTPAVSKGRKRKLPRNEAASGTGAKRQRVAGSEKKAGPDSSIARMESTDTQDPKTRPGHAESTQEEEIDSVPEPVGLPNPGCVCFANSVFQLLSVVLGKEAVSLLATDDASANRFGFSVKEVSEMTKSRRGGRGAQDVKLSELRQRIRENDGKREVSISGYLGRALTRLQSGDKNGSASESFMLREVFAYSGGEEAENFDGATQQDASEYLLLLLGKLVGEDAAPGHALYHELKETISCSCGKSEAKVRDTESATSLQVTIPPLPAGQTAWKLEELLEREMATETLEGYTCESCQKEGTSSRTKEMASYPEKLLVTINRTSGIDGQKVMTPVALPSGDIAFGTESYRMTAMVQHRGRDTKRGHYVAYRKHKDTWIELDDQRVLVKDVEKSMLDAKMKTSAIILLEKC